jgi:hypothetical protein
MLKVRRLLSLLACSVALLILGYCFALNNLPVYSAESFLPWSSSEDAALLEPIPDSTEDPHPIVKLLHDAQTDFDQLLRRETHDLASTARAYREKRGRHPPPGFDKWYKYAQENGAIVVEEFWDQIYHDLTPLWALDQKQMREHAAGQLQIIQIRNGKVTSNSDHFWVEIWKELVESVAKNIPDLDMGINMMDEPRLLIPWEEMNGYVETERKGRTLLPMSSVSSKYSGMLNYPLFRPSPSY